MQQSLKPENVMVVDGLTLHVDKMFVTGCTSDKHFVNMMIFLFQFFYVEKHVVRQCGCC